MKKLFTFVDFNDEHFTTSPNFFAPFGLILFSSNASQPNKLNR